MEKKKVAILTMNYRVNLGGILQCIALQNSIKSEHVEVEVIRFAYREKKFFKKLLTYIFSASITSLFVKLKIIFKYRNKVSILNNNHNIRDFVAMNINYTNKTYDEDSIKELSGKYDLIIVGSDKIWGNLYDERLIYFADWVDVSKTAILSYAVCSSAQSIPSFNKGKISTLLGRFTAISVRDEHTRDLIKPLTDKDVKIVVDPTLLHSFEQSIIKEPYFKGDYILTYILGKKIKGGHQKALREIKHCYPNCKIVSVVSPVESKDVSIYADTVLGHVDPYEWINLIAHAKFVYTDSFHGVIFSLKYHTDFLAYYSELGRSTRLIHLANQYSLQSHIVQSVQQAIDLSSVNAKIDFDTINQQINKDKAESLLFLEKILTYNK